ncbi:hypothetical protein [Lentzea guizhouensis]|nr:hypothetical protein [Lentzea guizhouensis]
MASPTKQRGGWKEAYAVLIVLLVFGLAALLVYIGYDPAIATAAVTTVSVAAAELVRRLRRGSGGGR